MEAVRAGGRVLPRLLLLIAVFLGVLTMHTLGQEAHSDHVLPAQTATHMASGHVAGAPVVVEQEKHGLAEVMALCLAVLLSAVVLAMPRWRAVFSAWSAAGLRPVAVPAVGSDPRSPPGPGLSLTRVAVIRV